jgi:thioredoxin-related protein
VYWTVTDLENVNNFANLLISGVCKIALLHGVFVILVLQPKECISYCEDLKAEIRPPTTKEVKKNVKNFNLFFQFFKIAVVPLHEN